MSLFVQVNSNKVIELLKYLSNIFCVILRLERSTKLAEEPTFWVIGNLPRMLSNRIMIDWKTALEAHRHIPFL
jgi:hypothetical protein